MQTTNGLHDCTRSSVDLLWFLNYVNSEKLCLGSVEFNIVALKMASDTYRYLFVYFPEG